MVEHADFQNWVWSFRFLVVFTTHPTAEGIALAWREADEARAKYIEREANARYRFAGPGKKKEPPALPSGKPGVKRRKR